MTAADVSSALRAENYVHAVQSIWRPLRDIAIGVLKTLGADNIARATRAIRDEPGRALPVLGITNDPGTQGT